jgi:hypothetical protein
MAGVASLSASRTLDAGVKDRIRGALWGIYIADGPWLRFAAAPLVTEARLPALSMPVHWYYQTGHIVRDFGKITDYQPPKKVRVKQGDSLLCSQTFCLASTGAPLVNNEPV